MSKHQFDAVKELITEKKYAEARVLLKAIDDPIARKWEAKLDEIDSVPSFPSLPPTASKRLRSDTPHFRRNLIVFALGSVVVLLLLLNMTGYFSPQVQHSIHFRETEVAEFTNEHVTSTAYAVARLTATETNTPTPTWTPTPVVVVTLVFPRTYYELGNYTLLTCPQIQCQSNMGMARGVPVTVVGITTGDWINHKSTLWYKIQILENGLLIDYYAPDIFFSETPPDP